jgi:DNA repair exonuclease SbcCD ATPase subunit
VRSLLRSRLAITAAGVALSMIACESDQLNALNAEIAKLQENRVQTSAVDGARREADDAERELAALREQLESARQRQGDVTARREKVERSITGEGDTALSIRDQIVAVQQETADEVRRAADLQQQIDEARETARFVRDQAGVLAREIRGDDPWWATARRVQSANEFVAQTARSYPDDPVLAALAAQPIEVARDDPTALARAAAATAQRAERVQRRIARIYELHAEPEKQPDAP